MIFKERVALYQPEETFEYGEYVRGSFVYQGVIRCHLKFEIEEESFVAQRKQALRQAIMLYEWDAYALSFRDIVEYNGIYYRLLTDPVPTTGMTRTFYRTKLIEDPSVVI